jgi:hypothetical protein
MDSIQFQSRFSELFQNAVVDLDREVLTIETSSNIIHETQLIGLQYEVIDLRLEINFADLPFAFFPTINSFSKGWEVHRRNDILIWDEEISLSLIDGITYKNFEVDNEDFIFTNHISFLRFLDFLKAKEEKDESGFHFTDVFYKDFRTIIFVGTPNDGRIEIKYGQDIPLFSREINLQEPFEEFISCFEDDKLILPKILKSSLISFVKNKTSTNLISDIFEGLERIIESAKINFEVYLSNLSIEKIQQEYEDLKDKYFEDLSKILGKLTTQIVALPIAISATFFVFDKIIENQLFTALFGLILFISTLYLGGVLKVNSQDLKYITSYLYKEHKKLISNGFFVTYPNEKEHFEELKNMIEDKIDFLKITLELYYWILNCSTIFVLGYVFWHFYPGSGTIWFSIVLGILVALFRAIYFNNWSRDEVKNKIDNLN